jgi:ABC-type lipoprotein export system ATPase subunit
MPASDPAIQLHRIPRYYSTGPIIVRAVEDRALLGVSGSGTGEAIPALLREQSPLGKTIVMVTHERALAENFAARLAIMGDGQLLSTPSGKGFAQ